MEKTFFRHKAHLLLLLFVIIAGQDNVRAQTTLQVATKTFEKVIGAPVVRTLHINAEKADIELVAWDKPDISVLLELSARHPDKSTSTKDLAKLLYVAERNGKDYFLRNFIGLKDGESKPVSNLKARYVIHVPTTCAINLTNTFGTISMKGITNSIRVKANFCTTSLKNLTGKGEIETAFGELKTEDVSGGFSFTSDHTNMHLENIGGDIKMHASYGNVEIYPVPTLTSLSIQSKKAVVTLLSKNWQQFDYTVAGAYSTMKLPDGFKWKRNTADFKDAFFSKNRLVNVQISAEFGNVTIK